MKFYDIIGIILGIILTIEFSILWMCNDSTWYLMVALGWPFIGGLIQQHIYYKTK